MDAEIYEQIQKMQYASFFRARHGEHDRIVNAPHLRGALGSAFERITRFSDVIVELGRLGVHEVHEIGVGLDAVVDSFDALDQGPLWVREGSIAVRRMAGGRC